MNLVAKPGPGPAAGPPAFSCACSRVGGVAWLSVAGELDIATVPKLEGELRRARAGASKVVLDLRALEFMDCRGAALLLSADRRIRQAGGRLVVLCGNTVVDWFFALTDIAHRLELIDSPPAQAGGPTVLEGGRA